jgi:UPF0271 protein
MAAREPAGADAIARATASVDRSLVLFGLAGSRLIEAGQRAGLRTAGEAFADRAYRSDGALVPRGQPGAIVETPDEVVNRVVSMVNRQTVTAIDGSQVRVEADTICVHGDTPGSANLAKRIRHALVQAGIDVVSVGSS